MCWRQVSFGTDAVGLALAVHALGSHGCKFEVGADGAAIAAAAGEGVDVVSGAVAVVVSPLDLVAGADGAFTANWVPVTTVT
jgi:hypothetical protein